MPNPPLVKDHSQIRCIYCGYYIKSPYPTNLRCPKCNKFVIPIASPLNEKHAPIDLDAERIDLKGKNEYVKLKGIYEYVKFYGITSHERTPLFASNKKWHYLLELTNNLDFIATSFLGGVLDKMLLKSENGETKKCQFFEKNNIIYILYGKFPDKKGKWILEILAKYFSDLVRGKDVNNLSRIDKYDIEKKFKDLIFKEFKLNFKEYRQLQNAFIDQEILYAEDRIRLYYVGLSSMSIGVISVLLDDEGKLNVKVPGEFEDLAEEIEMKEALLTAKIDAINANILGNTGAYPRWIAVKLGFQQYRFLTFRKCKKGYFLSCIAEGNLKKIEEIEDELEILLEHVIGVPFTGSLEEIRKIKKEIRKIIKEINKK